MLLFGICHTGTTVKSQFRNPLIQFVRTWRLVTMEPSPIAPIGISSRHPRRQCPSSESKVIAVPRIEPSKLKSLLQELDSPRFQTRERAQRELCAIRHSIEHELRRVVAASSTPLEQCRRISVLLASLPEEQRFQYRAVAILEQIGTQASQRLLQRLAAGEPEAYLTHQATEAVKRLSRRLPDDKDKAVPRLGFDRLPTVR